MHAGMSVCVPVTWVGNDDQPSFLRWILAE